MIVSVNGEPRELPEDATVASIATLMSIATEARGVAVALDGVVVPRGQWGSTRLTDGALLEVVTAVQGG